MLNTESIQSSCQNLQALVAHLKGVADVTSTRLTQALPGFRIPIADEEDPSVAADDGRSAIPNPAYGSTGPASERRRTLRSLLDEAFGMECYHGEKSRAKCVTELEKELPGAYLFRQGHNNTLVLSLKGNVSVEHHKITRNSSSSDLLIDGKMVTASCKTIAKLVTHLEKHSEHICTTLTSAMAEAQIGNEPVSPQQSAPSFIPFGGATSRRTSTADMIAKQMPDTSANIREEADEAPTDGVGRSVSSNV
jgi:hypothetical protein